MKRTDLVAEPWGDYELVDSGGERKLERYGAVILIRPETQALWTPAAPERWKEARAEFERNGEKGSWKKKGIPEAWELFWRDVRFKVRLTSFKHTGVFPEQAANWEWIRAHAAALVGAGGPDVHGRESTRTSSDKSVQAARRAPSVLNLFGYTGIASIAAAQAGARVTHVDASPKSNAWARENAALSGIAADGIRWITDDALKFAEREARRGASYDGIILDPPAFGRGPKGEVWHIERDLTRLLAILEKLLARKSGAFFLLNGYAAGYSPQSFVQAVEGAFTARAEVSGKGEFGELAIAESAGGRVVPSGIYVRFVL